MDRPENRSAARLPCRVPVSVQTSRDVLSATVVDLSRTGARIHAPLASLALPEDVTLLKVARHLSDLLPNRMPAAFDPQRLGPLVERKLDVIRIGIVPGPEPQVELGCRFHLPLSAIDVAAMGVESTDPEEPAESASVIVSDGLPRPKLTPERGAVPSRAPGQPSESAPGDVRRLRVDISPAGYSVGGSIHAWIEGLDAKRIVLLVPDRQALDLPCDCDDARTLLMTLCELIGELPKARIMDGSRCVWSGAVRLVAVETFVGDGHALRIELGFCRALRFYEKQALAVT